MFYQLLQFIIRSFFSSLIMILSGYYFLRHVFVEILSHNKYITISASYFIGVALFLSIYRILAIVFSNAYIALMSSLILALLISFLLFMDKSFLTKFINNYFKSTNLKNSFLIISLMICFSFYILLYWCEPNSNISNPFSTIGTLHSVRYSNISKFIFQNNFVPFLNQNYGQSLLSTIHLFLINKGSLLSLFSWLISSLLFLIFGIFGIFKYFKLSLINTILSTSIVMIGTSSISLVPTLIIDSGFPYIFNGYSDTIISIGTFLIFMYWFLHNLNNNFLKLSLWSLLFLFILFTGWNIFAPQNIVISIFLLFTVLFNYKLNSTKFTYLFIVFSSVLLFAYIGSNMGGMLFRSKLNKHTNTIQGNMTIDSPEKKFSIQPTQPYFIYGNSHWEPLDRSLGEDKPLKKSVNTFILNPTFLNFVTLFYRILWLIETNLWIMLKVLGTPIFGLIILLYLSKNYSRNKYLVPFIKYSLIILFFGILISFSFSVSSYKWELTRFLIPGVFLGMISISIFLFNFNLNRKLSYLVSILLILPHFFLSIRIIYNNSFQLFSLHHYFKIMMYH
jgi:hypothetical protein